MNRHDEKIEYKITFDIPAGYFDNLADNVMARIDCQDKKRKRTKTLVMRTMATAASICVVATLGFVFWPEKTVAPIETQPEYSKIYTMNLEAKFTDYNVMEYTSQETVATIVDTDNSDPVYQYYASPINFYYD